jgi:hypothetical protein
MGSNTPNFDMNPISRRSLLAASASGLARTGLRSSVADTDAGQIPWPEIGRIAREFVSQESPPTVFPFERPSSAVLANSSRKVFAHYFPFFVLSYENLPLDRDHWTQFLSKGGESGKWAFAGGFTRERPLTPVPWQSPYWREINAAVDIIRAQLVGIDGFGVDLTQIEMPRAPDQVRVIYDCAAALAPDFRLVLEPDGDILKLASPSQMASMLMKLASYPNIFRLPDGRVLLLPFGPNGESPEYWHDVVRRLEDGGEKIAFIPDLVGLIGNADRFAPISTGISYWGSRDPITADSPPIRKAIEAAKVNGKIWIQPVAPQDARPKSMILWEAGNTTLFRDLWGQAADFKAQYVHIITWNAYAEATEIAPSSGTQFLFYDLTAYYVAWFKTGSPPAIVTDAIYYSHRIEIFDIDDPRSTGGLLFRNLGKTPVRNRMRW